MSDPYFSFICASFVIAFGGFIAAWVVLTIRYKKLKRQIALLNREIN